MQKGKFWSGIILCFFGLLTLIIPTLIIFLINPIPDGTGILYFLAGIFIACGTYNIYES
jgi:hypothetical protein